MTQKAHFIGICGAGMSAVAMLLKQQGWEVTGSDAGFYPPVSDYLNAQEIPYKEGYGSRNIPFDVNLVVVGKSTNLKPENNAEVRAALGFGVPVKSYPQVIHDITQGRYNIVVAGSYGKSSCTALMAWCLEQAGKDPGYMIGAVPNGFETTSKPGSGPFVLEGDEYPSSNDDPRAKFLHYNAKDVLLTSASHDHYDIFPTAEDYHQPFIKLIEQVPEEGVLMVCADNEDAMMLAQASGKPFKTYGFSGDAEWSASNINYGATTTFSLTRKGEEIIQLETNLLGRHNVENIMGVGALLLERCLMTPGKLAKGIASFQGVQRRLDCKAPGAKIPVYEGFGSSYDKACSGIEAMKLHFPDRRLLVFFEPRTFSWRQRSALHWYDDVFEKADKVFAYMGADQQSNDPTNLNLDDIIGHVKEKGTDISEIKDEASGLQILKENLDQNDAILLLTSGDLDGLVRSVPEVIS